MHITSLGRSAVTVTNEVPHLKTPCSQLYCIYSIMETASAQQSERGLCQAEEAVVGEQPTLSRVDSSPLKEAAKLQMPAQPLLIHSKSMSHKNGVEMDDEDE